MKKLSIKYQLTLWFSLILILVSVVLFIAFYQLTKKYLLYETDRFLTSHASQIAVSISAESSNIHGLVVQNISENSKNEVPGMYIQVTDPEGNDINSGESPFKQLALQSVLSGKPEYLQTNLEDSSMRIISYPVEKNGSILGVVIMGHPTEVFQNTLSQLENIGLISLLFLVLPAICLGYLIADSATKPLRKISDRISEITSENLEKKIPILRSSYESYQLTKSFNMLLERLNDSFEREKQFMGEAAHEIKTPLAVIKSNAEITLSKERTSEDYKSALVQVLNHSDRLNKRLNNLLDFAWSQNRNVGRQFKEVDLSLVVEEICVNIKDLAKTKKIKLSCQIEQGLRVFGDEEKLSQAISNLVENAVKFTDKGSVEVNLCKENDSVKLEVKDTGMGIKPEEVKNIFNRFYRSEQNKNISGHGLGLAISDAIVKAHKGYIEVDSKEKKGSVFTVIIPLSS